jgi:hypothetical protein
MNVMSEVLARRPDYERSDARPALVASLAGGLALFIIATPMGIRLIYTQTANQAAVVPAPKPAGPPLQVDPAADLAAFRRVEAAQLTQYAWVDRASGRVRIPIARALALTAQRGLPGWQKP